MGTCWNCNKQVSLQEEQTKCDNCKSILFYRCNSCKEEFKVEKKSEKLKACSLCGYFFCPACGVCSWSCKKYKWQDEIMKILAPEFSFTKYPVLQDKIKKIIDYLQNEKTSNERKECIRNVPITYAKSRVKSLLAKIEGFRVKSNTDQNAFLKRIQEVTDIPIGSKITINKVREAGSYGQEYRDAFNLLVCMGKLQIKWIKKEDGEEYAQFERVEVERCKHLDIDNLIINECEKCKKRYSREIKTCVICGLKSKGKEKGQPFRTKERLNNCDTCQMYRGDFV